MKLKIVIGILFFVSAFFAVENNQVQAAAITAAQTGNWNSTSTWTGGVVPGAGDTVVIPANVIVTVSQNTTIGASNGTYVSGSVPGAIEFTGSSGTPGKITVTNGATLSIRGDVVVKFSLNVNARVMEFGPGTTWEWDATNDATSGLTGYRFGGDNNFRRVARVLFNGTSGSRVTVRSVGDGTKNGRFTGTFGTETARQDSLGVEAYYTDFYRVGNSTIPAIVHKLSDSSSNVKLILNNVTFTECGGVLNDGLYADTTFDINNVHWRRGVGTFSFSVNAVAGQQVGTGIRRVINSSWDQKVGTGNVNWTDVTLSNNVALANLGANSTISATALWENFTDSLLVMEPKTYSSGYSLSMYMPGRFSNVHGFIESDDHNTKWFNVNPNVTFNPERLIVEGGNPFYSVGADGVFFGLSSTVPTEQRSYTLRRVLYIPSASGQGIANVLLVSNNNPTMYDVNIENSTFVLRDSNALVSVGEGPTSFQAGIVTGLRNNLFWANRPGMEAKLYDFRQFTLNTQDTPEDLVTPANADYNASWNGNNSTSTHPYASYWTNQGNGYWGKFSSTPGQHDIDVLNPTWAGPGFVDSSRTLPRFDIAYLNGVRGMAEHATKTAWQEGVAYQVGDEVSVTWPDFYGGQPVNLVAVASHTSTLDDKPYTTSIVQADESTTVLKLPSSSASLSIKVQSSGTVTIRNVDYSISNSTFSWTVPANQTSDLYVKAVGGTATATVVSSGAAAPENSVLIGSVTAGASSITSTTDLRQYESPWRYKWRLRSLYVIANALRDGLTITDSSLGLSGDYYHIAAMEWIRAGFAPTNSLLKAAGYNGSDIGAVSVVDILAPSVTLTAPASSSTVSGSSVTLTAASTDVFGVVGVKFFRGSTQIGSEITATSSPNTYTTTWDTTVLPNGSYTLTAVARDAAGNIATSTAVSVTVSNAAPDTTPPVRSSGAPTTQLSAGTTQATLSLTTDEVSACKYGTTANTAYASIASTFANTASTSHSSTISGLSNGSSYTYYVRCVDSNSNANTDDYVISFSVVSASSGGGGASYVSFREVKVSSTTPTSTIISYMTDSSSSSEIQYGTTTTYGLATTSPSATTTHTVLLLGLSPNTLYHFRAKQPGLPNYSNDYTFLTLPGISTTSPTTTPPSTTPNLGDSLDTYSTSTTRLIKDDATYYLIRGAKKFGIANSGILFSHGFEFKDAKAVTDADRQLPQGSHLLPGNGSLVKSPASPTVYLISGGKRYGFTSANIFLGLRFKFGSVLVVTDPELQALPNAGDLHDPNAAHLDGVTIIDQGTVYWIHQGQRHPYPSLETYNSWNKDNDFSNVVQANTADKLLPLGNIVEKRILE